MSKINIIIHSPKMRVLISLFITWISFTPSKILLMSLTNWSFFIEHWRSFMILFFSTAQSHSKRNSFIFNVSILWLKVITKICWISIRCILGYFLLLFIDYFLTLFKVWNLLLHGKIRMLKSLCSCNSIFGIFLQ